MPNRAQPFTEKGSLKRIRSQRMNHFWGGERSQRKTLTATGIQEESGAVAKVAASDVRKKKTTCTESKREDEH